MALPRKYAHLNFTPPAKVAELAQEGLRLRKEFRRGGTMVGVARARDLKNQRTLSPSTVKRMVSFFARHEVDKQGKDWDNAKRPSNGYIAWLLWGGDSGRSWAVKLAAEMKKADRKK